jgi:hypothetical protein
LNQNHEIETLTFNNDGYFIPLEPTFNLQTLDNYLPAFKTHNQTILMNYIATKVVPQNHY